MFAPSRDEARRFLFETWAKYRREEPIAGLEAVALQVILAHPEYHVLLDDPDRFLARDYGPEGGEMNPFLHMSLHLAIEEQLSIDQPRGLRERYDRLNARLGSEHDAKHALLECLGEMLWQAQRNSQAPDERMYLECLDRKAGVRIQDSGFRQDA
jgi:hypothetical protein